MFFFFVKDPMPRYFSFFCNYFRCCSSAQIGVIYILLFLKLCLYIILLQTLRGLEIKRANEQEQEIERKRRRMLFDPGDFRSLNISSKKRARNSPTRGFTDIHKSIRWRIQGGGKNSKVQQGHRKAVNNAIKHVLVHPHTLEHKQRQDHLVLDTSSVEIN